MVLVMPRAKLIQHGASLHQHRATDHEQVASSMGAAQFDGFNNAASTLAKRANCRASRWSLRCLRLVNVSNSRSLATTGSCLLVRSLRERMSSVSPFPVPRAPMDFADRWPAK
jgi:hypothetical protein